MNSTDLGKNGDRIDESEKRQQTDLKSSYGSCLPINVIYGVFPTSGVDQPTLVKVSDVSVFTRDPFSSLFVKKPTYGKIQVLGYDQLLEEEILTRTSEQVFEEIDRLFSNQINLPRIIDSLTRMNIGALDKERDTVISIDSLLKKEDMKLRPEDLDDILKNVRKWMKMIHPFSKYSDPLGSYVSDELIRLQGNWGLARDIASDSDSYAYLNVPKATETIQKVKIALDSAVDLVQTNPEKTNSTLTKAYKEFLQEENLI